MPVIRDPDYLYYGEYDVNASTPINPYTASKGVTGIQPAGQPAQLLIDYENLKFALTAPKYASIGAGNTTLVGYGGTGGVSGQALYSKFKQIWKTDNIAIKFPFPMEAITPESFEFINGWEPDGGGDEEPVPGTNLDWFTTGGISTGPAITRKLLRDCGWAERKSVADGSSVKRQYFGVITLGGISLPLTDPSSTGVGTPARIYCSQLDPGITTTFPTNQIDATNDYIVFNRTTEVMPDIWTGNRMIYQQPDANEQGIGLTHNTAYYIRHATTSDLNATRPVEAGATVSQYKLSLHSTRQDALDGVNKISLTAGVGSSEGTLRNLAEAPDFFFNITEDQTSANEAFKYYFTNFEEGGFDEILYNYDKYFKIFCREKGRTYAEQAISQVGVTQINYQAYRIPLSTSADSNLVGAIDEVADSAFQTESSDFAGIGISFYQNPIPINVQGQPYDFNVVIDAAGQSLKSVYQKVQFLLRQPSKVGAGNNTYASINTFSAIEGVRNDVGAGIGTVGDVGAGTSYGNDLRSGVLEEPLIEFVGTNLFAVLRDDVFGEATGGNNSTGTNYGVYIANVRDAELNSVFYKDNDGVQQEEARISSYNLVFNTNLNSDGDARFWVFYDTDEVIAGLSTTTPIDQIGEHNVTDGINPTLNQIEFGAPREHHPFVNGQEVVAISTVSDPGIGITCETLTAGIVTFQIGRQGAQYYKFNMIPSDYAGKTIGTETPNPTVFVYAGDDAIFDHDHTFYGAPNFANHPFYIKEGNPNIEGEYAAGPGDIGAAANIVVGNGATQGESVTFSPVDADVNRQYYYICSAHEEMRGVIKVLDKRQDSPYKYYVNAQNPNTGVGQTYGDITESGDYPNVQGVGAAHSMRLHYTYLDAVAAGGLGINTIGLTTSTTNTGVVTFTQTDINYEENHATIVQTSEKQKSFSGGTQTLETPNIYLDGIDVPSSGTYSVTFDFTRNDQRNRQPGSASVKVVAIGLEGGQYVTADFTIIDAKNINVPVAGALERVYNDPTT